MFCVRLSNHHVIARSEATWQSVPFFCIIIPAVVLGDKMNPRRTGRGSYRYGAGRRTFLPKSSGREEWSPARICPDARPEKEATKKRLYAHRLYRREISRIYSDPVTAGACRHFTCVSDLPSQGGFTVTDSRGLSPHSASGCPEKTSALFCCLDYSIFPEKCKPPTGYSATGFLPLPAPPAAAPAGRRAASGRR